MVPSKKGEKMNKFALLLILIGLTVLLILVLFVAGVSATTYKVDVDQDYGFYRVVAIDLEPATDTKPTSTVLKERFYVNKTLNVNVGDTIIWVNDATPDWPLTIISNQGLWGDRDAYLRWNYQKFNYTFNESGVYSISLKECRRCQNQTIIVNPVDDATPLVSATMIRPTIPPTPISTPIITPSTTSDNNTPGFDIILVITTLLLIVYKFGRR